MIQPRDMVTPTPNVHTLQADQETAVDPNNPHSMGPIGMSYKYSKHSET